MGPEEYFCFCTEGYEGNNCETMADDPCDDRPCLNQAVECIPESPTEFTCVCSDGFIGSTCAINVDDCMMEPCQNGGFCVDGIKDFFVIRLRKPGLKKHGLGKPGLGKPGLGKPGLGCPNPHIQILKITRASFFESIILFETKFYATIFVFFCVQKLKQD